MMPYDFLEVYDYENSESNCEQICSYFDEVYNISDQSSKSSGSLAIYLLLENFNIHEPLK